MDKYLSYIKKFMAAVLIVCITIAVCIALILGIVPEFQKAGDIQAQLKQQSDALANAERELADLNSTLEKEKSDDEKIVKAFFNPSGFNVDNDTAISEEFNEILQMLRDNKIKTRTLSFEPDPADDNFVKHLSNKYYVSRMSAEMIATYTDFEGFLRDLYKHEHFLEIPEISIKPYEKNKRILIIELKIKLYAQKDGSSPQTSSQPDGSRTESSDTNNQPSSLGDGL